MKPSLVAFLFGVILIAVAILGGGFELKELKVPKVGWLSRFISGLVGAVFVVIGMISEVPAPIGGGGNPEPPLAINFKVTDKLSEDAISEKCVVVIDGREIGTLNADSFFPDPEISASVSKIGRYDYKTSCLIVFNQEGKVVSYNGSGSGMINIQPNKVFAIYQTWDGNSFQQYLKEEN